MSPILFGSIWLFAALAGSGTWTLRSAPIKVEAVLTDTDPETPEHMAYFAFDIVLSTGTTLRTAISGVHDLPEALAVVRAAVAWHPPYFFVRSECGGGTAWACNTDTVWRVVEGKAEPFGTFVVSDEPRRAGLSLHGDTFHDLYDALESGLPISHARSPSFLVVLRVVEGALTADLDATWSANADRYQQALEQSREVTSEVLGDEIERHEGPFAGFAEALAIAKYCGKTEVVNDVLTRARSNLPAEDLEYLKEMIGRVATGEILANKQRR